MSSSKLNKFPNRLRTAREKRGWTQIDLAENSGLQNSAVAHFENGRRLPAMANLVVLADALNVSADYLLGRDEVATATGTEGKKLMKLLPKIRAEDVSLLLKIADELAKRSGK